MRPRIRRTAALLLLLLLTACARAPAEAPPVGELAARTLYDLGGLETLKTRFNADSGRPRLVLLLSPT